MQVKFYDNCLQFLWQIREQFHGKNACVIARVPKTLVSQTVFISFIDVILASCADKISCIVRPGFPAFEIAALFTSTVRYPNSFSMTVHCRLYRVVIRNVQLKGFSKATDGCPHLYSSCILMRFLLNCIKKGL